MALRYQYPQYYPAQPYLKQTTTATNDNLQIDANCLIYWLCELMYDLISLTRNVISLERVVA